MPYQFPIRFGKYLLTRRIAVGGMAEVFKGKLIGVKGFEKTVAVKKILPEFNEDEEFVQMFVDEARISSNLHHPNIVQVFDFGEAKGSYFMAMEYMDGPNLKNLLQRCIRTRGRFPRNLALYIIFQIARALEYAHNVRLEGDASLNLVHRDISPQNVLITRNGEVKLTDFGIAKATIKLSKTQPGKIQGKFSYMSPEQALGHALDRRSDLFSLGIISFELLSGIKLYGGEDTQKRYKNVREVNIPRLGAIVPDLPGQLESLIMRMLSKDPDDRPSSAAEIIKELSEISSDISSEDAKDELGKLADELFPKEPSISSPKVLTGEILSQARDDGESNEPQGKDWGTRAIDDHEATEPVHQRSSIRAIFPFALFILSLSLAALFYFNDRSVDEKPTDSNILRVPEGTPSPNATAEAKAQIEIEEDSLLKLEEARKEREALEERLRETEKALTEERKERGVEQIKQAQQEQKSMTPPACPKDMVLIEASRFLFGSEKEDPDRNDLVEPIASEVILSSYCIDRYEFPNKKGEIPKTNISFTEALDACKIQNKRLCSEREWERACKGPLKAEKNRRFSYGVEYEEGRCNTEKKTASFEEDQPVSPSGAFKDCASGEAVFDLSGNVEEWTLTPGKFSAQTMIAKGGSSQLPGWRSRCAAYRELQETTEQAALGFRCCKDRN